MLGFLLLCCWCSLLLTADGLRTHHSRVAFVLPSREAVPSSLLTQQLTIRGGASVSVNEEESDFEEESDEEEEEEQEELDAALAASAVKSASKQQSKLASAKKSAVKKAVNAKLAPAKKKKSTSSGGLLKILHVPYIVRACMNPFTCIAMIKAYWLSLFNLDYLKPDASQELRSALEQKAKKSGGTSGSGRGKRKMKRGQAKTLSDLPALNT